MVKLVIFDLDGTLLNTIGDICHSLNAALEEFDFPKVTIEECKYLVGSGVGKLIERTLKKILGIKYKEQRDEYFEKLKERYQFYYEKWQTVTTRPYEDIEEILFKLKRMGIKLAVYSNKKDADAKNVVEKSIGLVHFDYVLGKREDEKIKPFGRGIEIISKALGVEDGIVYIGDTDVDIETAKNSNVPVIAVTWGFRKVSELYDATYIVDNPKDIMGVIQYV